MSETKDFPAWLAAQQNVPAETKAWMQESYAKLKEAKDSGAMAPRGFDVAVEMLEIIAEAYQQGTQGEVLKAFQDALKTRLKRSK